MCPKKRAPSVVFRVSGPQLNMSCSAGGPVWRALSNFRARHACLLIGFMEMLTSFFSGGFVPARSAKTASNWLSRSGCYRAWLASQPANPPDQILRFHEEGERDQSQQVRWAAGLLLASGSYFINYIIDPKEDISQSVVIFEWPTLTLDSHDRVRHHVSGIAAAILHGINLHLIYKYSGSTTLSVSRQCTIQYVNRANMLQRLLNIFGVPPPSSKT